MSATTAKETGTVKSWHEQHGFGFIERPGYRDMFVHATGIIGRRSLEVGDKVEYEIGEGDRGPKAINVRVMRDA